MKPEELDFVKCGPSEAKTIYATETWTWPCNFTIPVPFVKNLDEPEIIEALCRAHERHHIEGHEGPDVPWGVQFDVHVYQVKGEVSIGACCVPIAHMVRDRGA